MFYIKTYNLQKLALSWVLTDRNAGTREKQEASKRIEGNGNIKK